MSIKDLRMSYVYEAFNCSQKLNSVIFDLHKYVHTCNTVCAYTWTVPEHENVPFRFVYIAMFSTSHCVQHVKAVRHVDHIRTFPVAGS